MRTTVTLDGDVGEMIRRFMAERGISVQEAVNTAIRDGLQGRYGSCGRFSQRTFSLGAARNIYLDKALAAAGLMEDEALASRLTQSK